MRQHNSIIVTLLLSLLLMAATVGAAEEELQFDSGEVNLAGSLLLPAGEGPHPGLVFLHGSGNHDRNPSRAYASHFVKLGFAALIFDKRGCGASEGQWTRASLDDLAADAVAAFRTLASRPEVDPRRLGFFGGSQAAWVAPLASAKVNPAFLILMSGGGVTPQESERYSYGVALDRTGVDQEGRRKAEALLDQYFTYLETGEGRNRVVEALEEAEDWTSALGLDRVLPSDAIRGHWQWVATFDPMPWIEKLRMPVLLLFGDQDHQQPTERAVERWRQGLDRAGNLRVSIRVFEGAGHTLRPAGGAEEHHGHGAAEPPAPVEGFWSTIDAWVGAWLPPV